MFSSCAFTGRAEISAAPQCLLCARKLWLPFASVLPVSWHWACPAADEHARAAQSGAQTGATNIAKRVMSAKAIVVIALARVGFDALIFPLSRYAARPRSSTLASPPVSFQNRPGSRFTDYRCPFDAPPTSTFPANDRYTYVKYPAASIMPIVHQIAPTFNPYVPAFAPFIVSAYSGFRAGSTMG
jgi:hypothetical protein